MLIAVQSQGPKQSQPLGPTVKLCRCLQATVHYVAARQTLLRCNSQQGELLTRILTTRGGSQVRQPAQANLLAKGKGNQKRPALRAPPAALSQAALLPPLVLGMAGAASGLPTRHALLSKGPHHLRSQCLTASLPLSTLAPTCMGTTKMCW